MKWTRHPVVLEIAEIFSTSYHLILQNPRLLMYSFIYIVWSEIGALINYDRSLSYILRCLGLILTFALTYYFYVFSNYYIFYVYQQEGIIDSDLDILQESRNYFWKTVFQSFFGILIACLISLPVLVVGALMSRVFTSISSMFVIVGMYVIGLLFFGTVSLGQRILFDKKTGVVKSTMDGFGALSVHQPWYVYFYLIFFFCSSLIFWGRGILGATLTGIDLFSVPLTSIFSFLRNYAYVTSPLAVRLIFGSLEVFLFPYFSFLITYAYINRRKYEAQ